MPRLYTDYADWWPLVSAPGDYAEEAAVYRKVLSAAPTRRTGGVRSLLELGSGGGNNASHLNKDFEMTLVDLAPGMLDVSRELNPECRHVVGDMRTVRLGEQYDAVFVHDAVGYITDRGGLEATVATAHAHCRPGGVVLFVPDTVRETFQAHTSHGGHDGAGRALRYLEWAYDPDPEDSVYTTDYVFVLRAPGVEPEIVFDRHQLGLFSIAEWTASLEAAGFEATFETAELSGGETLHLFSGRRPI
jgi:SAM-dependent methyltransferase